MILVDPQRKTIRRNARINWIVKQVYKNRERRDDSGGQEDRGVKEHKYNKTTWKRLNTLQLHWYR